MTDRGITASTSQEDHLSSTGVEVRLRSGEAPARACVELGDAIAGTSARPDEANAARLAPARRLCDGYRTR
jgi:hypothetical protein